MKRLLLAVPAGLMLLTSLAPATPVPVYINNGVISDIDITRPPLQIDAVSFINRGQFTVARGYDIDFFRVSLFSSSQPPLAMWNTLNYTNLGTMTGIPGFRFDYSASADMNTPNPFNVRYSASFSNEKQASGANAVIHAEPFMLIQATNIYSSGTLSSADDGYIKMRGHNVNLTRGTIELLTSRLQALYWGVDTNDLTATFNSLFVTSSRIPVTYLFNNLFYLYNFNYSFTLLDGFTAYVTISPGFAQDFTIDALILGTPGPGVSTEVRFGSLNGPTTKSVSWFTSYTNRVNGDVVRNALTLQDDLAIRPANALGLQQDGVVSTLLAANVATFRPRNYTLIEGFGFATNGILMNPVPFDPTIFEGAERFPSVTNTAYGARVTAESHPVNPLVAGATYSNVFGRVEMTASKVLDLTGTRIHGQSFLLLESTNHFVGSTNASIISPFTTIKLGSTNASMTIANLLQPFIPSPVGEVEVWSGRWTNSGALGSVLYNVTIVDGRLTAEAGTYVDVLDLRANELVIGDILNVLTDAKLDAERLTVVTNHPNAAAEQGELNFLGPNPVWSATFPRLKYFTNYSQVLSSNTIYFAGTSVEPWLTQSYNSPYEAFVNYGSIITHGNEAWAKLYSFSGTNNSGVGPISVRSVDAEFRNGALQAPLADVYLNATRSLISSNLTIDAGRGLTIDVASGGYLVDGSLTPGSGVYNVINSTNTQVWKLGSGINLPTLPALSSLLATKVMLGSYYNLNVVTRWAGKDFGCDPNGYVGNAAIGHLLLDGTNHSLFSFEGAGANTAIYVDRLELTNWAAPLNSSGEPTGIHLAPGFKVYFAQAIADGLDISDRLNGKSGGQFCWVSAYPGAFSSTNMVYEDGTTHLVNASLARDCNQDSDNDGIPNCLDPYPINTFWTPPVLPSWTPGPDTGGGDDGGTTPPPDDPKDEVVPDNGLPKLVAPTPVVPYSGPATTMGTYYALFYDADGVTVPGSGFLKLTVAKNGTYSGKLLNAGASYSFTGRLKNGAGSNVIRKKGKAPIEVSFVVNDPIGKIHGTVAGADWSADLAGDRQVHSAKNKSPFAGRYTMVIPPFEYKGFGHGTVVVKADGSVVWSATLGDGTKATQGSAASGGGVWPLYFSNAGGKSVVASWMQFSTNDLGGQLIWIKPGQFTRQAEAVGSRYKQPKASQPMLTLPPHGKDCYGKLVFMAENLTSITNTVVFKNGTRATFQKGTRTTLQMTPGTGVFKGTFRNPANGKAVSFQGAVVQDEGYGAGSFNLNGIVGRVYLVNPTVLGGS